MPKQTLPTDFKDDIMSDAMDGKRRYRLINNTDGTVSLEDVTTYTQTGSAYGAAQVNTANTAINAAADAGKIIDDVGTLKAVTENGYIAGAKAVADLVGEINSNIASGPNTATLANIANVSALAQLAFEFYTAAGFLECDDGRNIIVKKSCTLNIRIRSNTNASGNVGHIYCTIGVYKNGTLALEKSFSVLSVLDTSADIECNAGCIINFKAHLSTSGSNVYNFIQITCA